MDLNTDAKTLKERMSHQTSKLIKLRVNQHAAYWDLKEKLVGVEADHEPLQQNMLEVQMQHEDLSAQHQEELRKRHETLNKVVVSREICDELKEEHAERVRPLLQRAAADRAALATAYDIAAQRVQAATAEHAHVAHESQLKASAQADKLRMSVAHGERMESSAIMAQRQVEKERGAAREELRVIAEHFAELRARREEVEQRAARAEAALQERDQMNTELMREMERRAAQSNAVAEHEALLRAELQKEIEARGEALAAAVARGDAAAHGEARAQAALAAAVARGDAAAHGEARAQAALAAAYEHDERRNDEMATLIATVQNRETMVISFKRQGENIAQHNEKLLTEIENIDRERQEIATRVQNMQRELDVTRAARDEAALRLRSVLTELDAVRVARANDAAKATEQKRAIEERSAAAAALAERTLVERADTVARLMRDVAAEAEARARCDTALQAATKAKEDVDAYAHSMDTKLLAQEKKLAALKMTIRKMGIEKELLQDEIRDMQRSIDYIHKETSLKTSYGKE